MKDTGKISAREAENSIALHVKGPWPLLWEMPAGDVTRDDLLPVLARIAASGKLRAAGKIRSHLCAAYAAAIRARQGARAPASMRALAVSANPARDLATIEGSSAAKDRAPYRWPSFAPTGSVSPDSQALPAHCSSSTC
ncbi:hypothetical protein XSP_002271 [Xanthomonas euroxanthea]|uniref:Integrase n=1 Tax=Xanthomonas euroxanthea TaxID=2259622 RepID=A0A8E4E0Q8_9XANT|nr:hypothetical protein [Xanthomonas euroxanthea]CAD1792355.1 hypothetical protein XSP_002271 [Xanthomonas euroxanthea]